MDIRTDDHDENNDHDDNTPAREQPATPPTPPRPRRPRRKRPNGRWSNPASPLQAARFARRKSGKDVVAAIRRLCSGHADEPCKIDVSKLSDYETGNRALGREHIVAFCRYYQKSPEELGLIEWRNSPIYQDEIAEDPDEEQLVLDWLRDSAVSVAVAALRALARCPIKLSG